MIFDTPYLLLDMSLCVYIYIYICMHILHWFAYIYIINITWSNYIQPYGHLRCWQSSQSCRKWSQKSSEPRPSASTRVQWTTTGSTNGWSLNTGRFDNFDPQPLVTIGWGVWYAHSSFAMDLGYLQGIEHESECRISVRMDGMNSEIWSGEIGFCKNGTGCSSMYKRFQKKDSAIEVSEAYRFQHSCGFVRPCSPCCERCEEFRNLLRDWHPDKNPEKKAWRVPSKSQQTAYTLSQADLHSQKPLNSVCPLIHQRMVRMAGTAEDMATAVFQFLQKGKSLLNLKWGGDSGDIWWLWR